MGVWGLVPRDRMASGPGLESRAMGLRGRSEATQGEEGRRAGQWSRQDSGAWGWERSGRRGPPWQAGAGAGDFPRCNRS